MGGRSRCCGCSNWCRRSARRPIPEHRDQTGDEAHEALATTNFQTDHGGQAAGILAGTEKRNVEQQRHPVELSESHGGAKPATSRCCASSRLARRSQATCSRRLIRERNGYAEAKFGTDVPSRGRRVSRVRDLTCAPVPMPEWSERQPCRRTARSPHIPRLCRRQPEIKAVSTGRPH